MANQRVPILVYHHVYTDDVMSQVGPSPGVIGETDFRRQLKYIVDEGWKVVSTSQIVDWLIDGASLPQRAAALHFDNGWVDTRTIAMPILQEFGMTGMCYVITSGLDAASRGRVHTVRTETQGVIESPFMTWQDVRALLDAGWEIGAHTATHCRMADKLATEGGQGILWEVNASNTAIEEQLGFVPEHFAYPSGSCNARTGELLSTIYRSQRGWRDVGLPIVWRFTDRTTSPTAIEPQNIDSRVPLADFQRVFTEASDIGMKPENESGS